jgi:hypothetical protein
MQAPLAASSLLAQTQYVVESKSTNGATSSWVPYPG